MRLIGYARRLLSMPPHQAARLAAAYAGRAAVRVVRRGRAMGGHSFGPLREGAAPACVGGAAPIELLRFYVDPAWQGRGVAQSLMDAVVAEATTRGAKTVWLGVWERNPRAIAFYAKSGFRDAGSQPFVLGTDRQTDRIMVRAI